ncbi:hypothetical protein C8R44DRAFT_776154 [Mycena epipterygia]|nr:hypothetical protein C8R44DRAFT_776154 [Mycena epipterygia]
MPPAVSTADLRRRLLQLDAQILEQKLVLHKLEQTRLEVERKLIATATFPVVQLPVEIATKIFLQCLPAPEDKVTYDMKTHMRPFEPQAPLALASVCWRWRDIALSTAGLWSTIRYDLSYPIRLPVEAPEVMERYIKRWLDRAVSQPLSIFFYLRGEDECKDLDDSNSFTPNRLRNLIHSYSHTIQHISLDMCQHTLHQLGLDFQHFPVLKSANFGSAWSGYRDPDRENPVNVFVNAPQLHDICLDRPGAFSYFVLPWSQLTKFDGDIDTMDLFALAPNIVEARCSMQYLLPSPTSVIFHPQLRSLTLTKSVDSTKPLDILEYLTLPALQTLHISEMEDTSYPSLHTFLSRSSPPLLALSIRLDDEDFFDWDECFTCVGATLENLELEFPSVAVQHSLFEYRTKPAKFAFRFPNLRTLSLSNAPHTNYSPLVEFLYRIPKLRSFRLHCERGAFLDDKTGVWGSSGFVGHDDLKGHFVGTCLVRSVRRHVFKEFNLISSAISKAVVKFGWTRST